MYNLWVYGLQIQLYSQRKVLSFGISKENIESSSLVKIEMDKPKIFLSQRDLSDKRLNF